MMMQSRNHREHSGPEEACQVQALQFSEAEHGRGDLLSAPMEADCLCLGTSTVLFSIMTPWHKRIVKQIPTVQQFLRTV